MTPKHTWVDDSQSAHPVVLPTRCAQLDIVAAVVMDTGLGQHGVVLYFRFPLGIKQGQMKAMPSD